MISDKETPEHQRKRVRLEELRKNPTGNVNDVFNRTMGGGLVDLVGSLGWKGTGILILVLLLGFILYSVFF